MNNEKKQKILIVEDESINQLFLSSILKKEYNTFVAGNAAQATKILEKEKIDLILMDISLKGGKNGFELTKEIRETNLQIPIIAITGFITENELHKTIEAGCNKYITKPFDKNTLLKMIKSLLDI